MGSPVHHPDPAPAGAGDSGKPVSGHCGDLRVLPPLRPHRKCENPAGERPDAAPRNGQAICTSTSVPWAARITSNRPRPWTSILNRKRMVFLPAQRLRHLEGPAGGHRRPVAAAAAQERGRRGFQGRRVLQRKRMVFLPPPSPPRFCSSSALGSTHSSEKSILGPPGYADRGVPQNL